MSKLILVSFLLLSLVGKAQTDLFISEYIEGSSNNKAIEIYNGTGASVNLSAYEIRVYVNGGSPLNVIPLSGNLANNDVFVLANPSAIGAITSQADLLHADVSFNGDDAVALYSGSTRIDLFGNEGCDPGSNWMDGGNSTVNQTLIRNNTVCDGITTDDPGNCPFPTLATEWTSFSTDYTADLGMHDASGCGCAPPTLQPSALSFSGITDNSMTISWASGDGNGRIVVMREGSPVTANPTSGMVHSANSIFGSGDDLGANEYVVFRNTGTVVNVTNLSPGATYHVAIFEYLTLGECYLLTTPLMGSQTTTCTSASDPTSVSSTSGNTQVDISWTNPSCFDEVMIVAKAASSITQAPTGDGTAYIDNLSFGSGTAFDGGFVVYKGSISPQTISALTNNTNYFIKVWGRKGTTWSSGVEITETPAAPPTIGQLFISEYIEGSNNNKAIEIYNGTGSPVALGTYSIRIYANGATAPSSTINLSGSVSNNDVFVLCHSSANGMIQGQADQMDPSLTFTGNDAIELFDGTNRLDLFGNIGCNPGPEWINGGNSTENNTLVRKNNVCSGINVDDLTNCPFPTLGSEWTQYTQDETSHLGVHDASGCTPGCGAPTTQPTGITFSAITASSMTVSWTNGDGDGRIVVAREAASVDATPTSGIAHTANVSFGSGDDLGTAEYVVYRNSGGSVNVTGLNAGTNYHFAIFEYKNTGDCYQLTGPLVGSQATPCVTPTNPTGVVAGLGDQQAPISWSNPTCFDEVMIVAKATSSITQAPTGDGTAYTGNLAYGSGTSFDGGFVVYKGSGSPQIVTGLTNGTTYFYKIWGRKGTSWSSGVEVSQTPVPPQKYYVNDGVLTADVYTSAVGQPFGTNTGQTPASPLNSLQEIFDNYDIEPGDIIYVDAGTYNEKVTITNADGGTVLNKVIITGVAQDKSVFHSNVEVMNLTQADHIEIRDLGLISSTNLSINCFEALGCDGVILEACSLRITGSTGANFNVVSIENDATVNSNNCTVNDCIITHDGNGDGININGETDMNSGSGNVVSNNIIGSSTPTIGDAINIDKSNNFSVFNNRMIDWNNGIRHYGGLNGSIYNNYIKVNGRGYEGNGTSGVTNNGKLYFNSFYTLEDCIFFTNSGTDFQTWEIVNNILYSFSADNNDACIVGGSGGRFSRCDYNLYHSPNGARTGKLGGTLYNGLAIWQTIDHSDEGVLNGDENSGEADPMYVNAPAGDLDLNGGSPAQFVGQTTVGITKDIREATRPSPPSMGAFDISPPLCGTYTIGGSSPDYASIDDAINSLTLSGVSCPCIFNIRDGVYNEQLSFGSITGASNSNNITFQSESMDHSLVEITTTASIIANYTIEFSSTQHISLSQLTISATHTTYGRAVGFIGTCSNINIQNCVLNGVSTTSISDDLAVVYMDVAADQNNILIKENTINNGSIGIKFGSAGGLQTGNQITDNDIVNFYYQGIFADNQNAIQITGNQVSTTSLYGGVCEMIYCRFCDNATRIVGNETVGTPVLSTGIRMYHSDGIATNELLISNNMIVTRNKGILFDNCNEIWAYHNSINILGTTARGIELITGGANIELKNNIVSASGGGYAIYEADLANGAIEVSNYNDYYTTGVNLGYTMSAGDQTNITNWNTNTGFDGLSISEDPIFESPNDLLLTTSSPSALQAGDNLNAIVPNDIEGHLRFTVPFMGADERVFYYWVADGGNWGDAGSHWSRVSGSTAPGDMHAAAPTDIDNIIFDSNSLTGSGQVITIDVAIGYGKSIDFQDPLRTPIMIGSGMLVIGQ